MTSFISFACWPSLQALGCATSNDLAAENTALHEHIKLNHIIASQHVQLTLNSLAVRPMHQLFKGKAQITGAPGFRNWSMIFTTAAEQKKSTAAWTAPSLGIPWLTRPLPAYPCPAART